MSDVKCTMVKERIEVLVSKGESFGHQEFVDKVDELYKQNMHKAYEKFSVVLEETKELGWIVSLMGERQETKEETAKREADEAARRKRVETAELAEYLKLKKKYGKKEE